MAALTLQLTLQPHHHSATAAAPPQQSTGPSNAVPGEAYGRPATMNEGNPSISSDDNAYDDAYDNALSLSLSLSLFIVMGMHTCI